MMEIVAHEPIAHGSLRRHGANGGMAARGRHEGIEAAIGVAVNAHLAVILADLAQKPLHRIVNVARLVSIPALLVRDKRAHVHELALAHPAAADILKNEDVLRLEIVAIDALLPEIGVLLSVRGATVRGAHVEYRMIAAAFVLRGEDCGIESHAVAHGDHVFGFRVMLLEPFGVDIALGADSDRDQRQKQQR